MLMKNRMLKEDDEFIDGLKELIRTENEDRKINNITLNGGKIKEQIIECGGCGNKGINKVIASYSQMFDEYVGGRRLCDEYAHIYLLECPVCSQLTLISYDWNTNMFDKEGNVYLNKKVLYPSTIHSFPNTPKQIVAGYESAWKTMRVDNGISLIAIRKVLELICKERGSKGKNLESMIKDLVSRGIFPNTLDKCGLLIRKLGNAGAHKDDEELYVTNRDLGELIEFIETIIYYIYELPVKISRLNERYLA